MKKIVWLFIDKKKLPLLLVMDFWSQKIWIGHLTKPSQNEIFYIHSLSQP
jgi:hypothetical protein